MFQFQIIYSAEVSQPAAPYDFVKHIFVLDPQDLILEYKRGYGTPVCLTNTSHKLLGLWPQVETLLTLGEPSVIVGHHAMTPTAIPESIPK